MMGLEWASNGGRAAVPPSGAAAGAVLGSAAGLLARRPGALLRHSGARRAAALLGTRLLTVAWPAPRPGTVRAGLASPLALPAMLVRGRTLAPQAALSLAPASAAAARVAGGTAAGRGG